MPQPQSKRARHDFTLSEKVWLLDYSEKNPKVNAKDLSQALADYINRQRSVDQVPVSAPGKSTVNDWRKSACQLRNQLAVTGSDQSKRNRAAQFPLLDQALVLWFKQQEARDLPITDELLREQAKRFGSAFDVPSSFSYSAGCLVNFKKRHGIK
jgi:hypothetical protein